MNQVTLQDARALYAELMPWAPLSDAALQRRVDEAIEAAADCAKHPFLYSGAAAPACHSTPNYWLRFYADQDADYAVADSNEAAETREWAYGVVA